MEAFVVDLKGVPLDLSDRFVGVVDGDSCSRFGLRNGAEFVARFLADDEKPFLKRNDVVVVDADAKHHETGEDLETGRRLRIVDFVEDGNIRFRKDGYGRPRRSRPLGEVEALLTHVRSN
jgi:hypothetical protein